MNLLPGIQIDQSVLPEELKLWPLVHGSHNLNKNHMAIRQNGLLAPSKTSRPSNTRWEDKLMNRDEYIFLAPIRLKNGYGLGSFLLVDPVILSFPDNHYYLYDSIELVREIRNHAEGLGKKSEWPDWVIHPELLESLISTEKSRVQMVLQNENASLSEDEVDLFCRHKTTRSLLASLEFIEYWKNYNLSVDLFMESICRECRNKEITLWS